MLGKLFRDGRPSVRRQHEIAQFLTHAYEVGSVREHVLKAVAQPFDIRCHHASAAESLNVIEAALISEKDRRSGGACFQGDERHGLRS